MAQTIAQVTYSCGEDKLVYRTSTEQEAPGRGLGEFPWESSLTCGASTVSVLGDQEDVILHASWQRDGMWLLPHQQRRIDRRIADRFGHQHLVGNKKRTRRAMMSLRVLFCFSMHRQHYRFKPLATLTTKSWTLVTMVLTAKLPRSRSLLTANSETSTQ